MDSPPPDEVSATLPELRQLSLRYPGTCVVCGTALAKGAEALYDPSSRTVRCLKCPRDRADSAEEDVDSGVAGSSAHREYERRKAGREVRIKGRFGKRIGGLILALTGEPQSTRAWARGARGEEELGKALAEVEGIRVLHDRSVPGTPGNIDHIVVAPAGVFVVDAKRYEGLIRIRDVGWLFKRDERLYVGRRDCSKLAENMGWQVEVVERALSAVPVRPMPPITPVLCFVNGEWPLFSPPDSYHGVRLEGTNSIRKLLTVSRVLDATAIERLGRLLATALPPK